MLYGPSGVGKTESAKSISKTMGGELLRIQFSMMQTAEAYNYVFGAEHSKGSFARGGCGHFIRQPKRLIQWQIGRAHV